MKKLDIMLCKLPLALKFDGNSITSPVWWGDSEEWRADSGRCEGAEMLQEGSYSVRLRGLSWNLFMGLMRSWAWPTGEEILTGGMEEGSP